MNMTKRDIVDIVLVGMAITFMLSMLFSLIAVGTSIAMTCEAGKFIDQSVAVAFACLHLLALFLLNYLLLFKRRVILSLVVPDGDTKELSIPDNLEALASYAFWIRLIGLFLFLTSGIEFISQLGMALASKGEFSSHWPLRDPGTTGIKAVMGLLLIGRAEWMAKLLRLDGQPKRPRR